MNRWHSPLAMVALLAAAVPAQGRDGVLQINQVCATLTGCFSGDASGFPVTIGSAGSYRLTSNLTVVGANQDAIEVTVDGVALDLNGFELAGPVTCTGEGSSVGCTFPGSTGMGVDAVGVDRLSVRNGSVRGFAAGGIDAEQRARIRGVIADANGNKGIAVGDRSSIERSISVRNAGSGIVGGAGSRVAGCVASANFLDGIRVASGGSIARSVAQRNGDDGLVVGSGGLVRVSNAINNEDDGVATGPGSHVSDVASAGNDGDGVDAGAGASVQRSTLQNNGTPTSGFALRLGSEATYRENTLTTTSPGGAVTGGLNLGDNACDGAVCP